MKDKLKHLFEEKRMNRLDIALAVSGVSGCRTTLVDELTPREIEQLINIYRPKPVNVAQRLSYLEMESALKNKRAIVLKDAQKVGIHNPDNWGQFNGWMIKSSILHKPLKDYNYDELDALIRQMKKIVQKFDAYSEKAGSKAWFYKHKLPKPSKN